MRPQCAVHLLIVAASAVFSLTANAVEPPTPIKPMPSANQLAWQDMELTAFCHFGINTFYDQEWGKGTEVPNRFYPTNFDAVQWVAVLKKAGFKELILTAKHHDGFCLWPSAFTDHSVKSSSWYKAREAAVRGRGDVVKAVADACHKLGLKFGVYLSPWDRNNPAYGKGDLYNAYYENQLRELLSNYGVVSEVWWDGAKGDNTPQEYDFSAWAAIVHQLQPTAVIFQGDYNTADVRWVGNENGHAPATCWSTVDQAEKPDPDGSKWMPAETDVSIRPGWFCHRSEDSKVKSVNQLISIYLESVGRNSQLLLNVPPDTRGLFTEFDREKLLDFQKRLEALFKANLAEGATATASDTRGAGFEATKAIDADPATYWAVSDGVTNASLTVDLGPAKRFDMIELQEPIQLGQRVMGYTLEAFVSGEWKLLADKQCIGHKALVTFTPVETSKVRLNITHARACPAISEIRIYNAPLAP